jgi:hypothetical protein
MAGLFNQNITKGRLGNIDFQLNPTEITHDDGANWGEIVSPGMQRPITTYNSGRAGTYTFTLYFNNKHTKAVNIPAVKKELQSYRIGRAPLLFTYMGSTTKVVMQECSFQILSMDSKLNPTEMNVSITLKEIYT